MPRGFKAGTGELVIRRGERLLRIVPVQTEGRRVYIGFQDEEPVVVSRQSWKSLQKLIQCC